MALCNLSGAEIAARVGSLSGTGILNAARIKYGVDAVPKRKLGGEHNYGPNGGRATSAASVRAIERRATKPITPYEYELIEEVDRAFRHMLRPPLPSVIWDDSSN